MPSNSSDGRVRLGPYQRAAVGVLLLPLALIAAQSVSPSGTSQSQTQSQTSAAPNQPGQPLPNQPPDQAQPPVQPIATPPKPLIMIDPAHGGSDSGAILNPTIL